MLYGNTGAANFSHVEGHTDHGVDLLFLWDAEGRLTGLVINLACTSQETENLNEISADFWHDVREELRKRHGADLAVFPQCSAAGDQSPHPIYRKQAERTMDARRGLSRRQEIARRIANAVDDVLPVSLVVLRADRPEAGKAAENAVKDAEHAASAIWLLAENIAQAAGAEPKSGAGDSARERLYAALEHPYRRWLASLLPGVDTDRARAQWQQLISEITKPIVDEVISSASPSAWVGREVRSHLVNVALAEA